MYQGVVLCGGSGTRLWPLSRKAFPKQFVPLIGGKSLLSLTLERLKSVTESSGVICVGAEEHRFLLREAIESCDVPGRIILEPHGRNTAAAMTLAALGAASPSQLLLFCPCDHHIPDVTAFGAMVKAASIPAERGAIVTFGVIPSFPSTAYGYIEQGAAVESGGFRVVRFIEKPDSARAQELLLAGNVLWNGGIFLCKAETLLDAMAKHAPDILANCTHAMREAEVDGTFVRPAASWIESCRSESIDYAVMEKNENTVVVPFDGAWSDVGSWNAVADLSPPDEAGNRVEGNGVAIGGKNNYIHAPHRRVVVLGTDDLVVVDTPDAVLVTKRSAVEQVKTVVSELERRRSPEALNHRMVMRPWGSYDSIQEGQRFQVKRIVVKPSAALSLQKHYHRAEHWIVVKGTAEVTRGKETFLLSENQSTYIPLGELHRLHNPGKTPLELIEVQSGSYLGEDDIVRYDDNYGRVVVPISDAKKTA